MTSIRRRLSASLLAATAAAFAVAGAILHVTVHDALVAEFDRGLEARARALASLVELDEGVVEFDYPDAMAAFDPGPEAEYFAMWRTGSQTAQRSRSLAALGGDALLPRPDGLGPAPAASDLELPDGRAGRALAVAVTLRPEDDDEDDAGAHDGAGANDDGDELDAADEDDAGPHGGDEVDGAADGIAGSRAPGHLAGAPHAAADGLVLTVVVARSRAELDARLAALATGLGAAALAALVLVAWGVGWAVRRGLAPMGRLSAEVAAIDATSLARRIPTDGVPDELVPFTRRLDELLARLAESFAKERRMTAAMAHELRTPIAELRAASDVARRWPDDEVLADALASTAADVALRMSRAVDAALHYCRLAAGQAAPRVERVALAPLVDDLWQPCERLAQQRGLDFRNAVGRGVAVDTDAGLLGIVVRNLLDNAASFAAAGAVEVSAGEDDGAVVLRVANETDQLEPSDVERLGEPFWRKDAARGGDGHSGLGLALVTAVAAALGGRADFALRGRRFVASVRLPVAGPRAGSARTAEEPDPAHLADAADGPGDAVPVADAGARARAVPSGGAAVSAPPRPAPSRPDNLQESRRG